MILQTLGARARARTNPKPDTTPSRGFLIRSNLFQPTFSIRPSRVSEEDRRTEDRGTEDRRTDGYSLPPIFPSAGGNTKSAASGAPSGALSRRGSVARSRGGQSHRWPHARLDFLEKFFHSDDGSVDVEAMEKYIQDPSSNGKLMQEELWVAWGRSNPIEDTAALVENFRSTQVTSTPHPYTRSLTRGRRLHLTSSRTGNGLGKDELECD